MASKFNRNDSNAGDDRFYMDDYRADLNGVEEELRERVRDFERLPAIGGGLTVTSPSNTSDYIEVSGGWAYDGEGRKVIVPSTQQVQLVDLGGGNNYIVLRYRTVYDTPRKAFETGVEYNTRVHDGFELLCVPSYEDGDVVLGNVRRESGENVIYTNERTLPVAKPQVVDTEPPPAPVITGVETGLEVVSDRAQTIDLPRTAWVRVSWAPVSDSSGIAAYEVVWIPVEGDPITPLPVRRREAIVAYAESPVRNDFTFYGIPVGERGIVKVRAVDGAGNKGEYAVSEVITAGGEGAPTAPSISVETRKLGVEVIISGSVDAAGFEVYADVTDPGTDKGKLVYRGPKRRVFIPAEIGQTVHVRVRAFNEAGLYSDEVLGSAVAGGLTMDEIEDGTVFKKQPLQKIEDLYSELVAARGNLASLHERLERVVDLSGNPTTAVSIRQVSFDLSRAVEHDFGVGTKKVAFWFETPSNIQLYRFHLMQYSDPPSPYQIEIWEKSVGGVPELLDSETVSEKGLVEFLHAKSNVEVETGTQIFICVSTSADAQGVLTYIGR